MPQLSPDALRDLLNRDLPGAVVEAPPLQVVRPTGHAKVSTFTTADVLVKPERILDVALYLRDQVGYTYLSDIAVVDYLLDGLFEVVYRFFHLDGGPSLAVKTRMPREAPTLPSLTPQWPGANFHEREAYDLYGIVFTGHPFLRRIYMWDEFEGFPMRKDFPKQGDKYIGEEE